MGYALTVLPLTNQEELEKGGMVVPREQLNLTISGGICSQLKDVEGMGKIKPIVESRPLPENIRVLVFHDEGAYETDEDGYGEKLTYVLAKDLKDLDMTADYVTPFHLATKAYIDALPGNTPIVLFWD
jgi:hypothetical protein